MKTTTLLSRLPTDGDLLEELTILARSASVAHGSIQLIGALQYAVLGYYDQQKKKYLSISCDYPVEIASGLGNISQKDGELFIHLHLVLSRSDGSCMGGHALSGCRIFAAEACLLPTKQKPQDRVYNPKTGLYLWDG